MILLPLMSIYTEPKKKKKKGEQIRNQWIAKEEKITRKQRTHGKQTISRTERWTKISWK